MWNLNARSDEAVDVIVLHLLHQMQLLLYCSVDLDVSTADYLNGHRLSLVRGHLGVEVTRRLASDGCRYQAQTTEGTTLYADIHVYCIVLYCIVLYCTVLYCIVLHCII